MYVDGELLDEPYINEPTYLSYAESGQALEYPAVVPEGCIFVMGDNRNHSSDSRLAEIGALPYENIIGKVFFRIFPFTRLGTVQ